MDRMNMIRDLFKTAQDFLRLEKVEIGGVKGKALSGKVVKILEDFKEEFEKFNNKKYDPLDPVSNVSQWNENKHIIFLNYIQFWLF